MKAMNYLILITLMVFGASCTEPDVYENELSATKAQHSSEEEYDFLNGLEMFKRSTEVQLFELDELIGELTEAIEGGEEGHEEELEDAQQERELLREYQELMNTFRVPRGGRGPGPKPPKGCFVANCNDGIDIRGVHGIAISQEISIEGLVIEDNEGQIVGEGTELSENQYGDLTMRFETQEFEGVGTMYITIRLNEGNLGKAMMKIPVSFE